MNDKENGNLPSTPKQISSTHSRNGSPLKPVSPNKHNTGKLTFLQNDAIDDHFNYIHSSTNEIQQQLMSLEVQTKQTALDLAQLCDRSKNNNQNLNKLLENIAQYSNEVVTEGNATKNDITNIMTRLDSLNGKLQQNIVGNESLLKVKENELKLVHEFIQQQEQRAGEQKQEIQHLSETIEKQSALIEKLLADRAQQNALTEKLLADKAAEHKYNDVSEKYKLLCKAYEEKFHSYKELEMKFSQLSSLEGDSDNDRLTKLNKFHNRKLHSQLSASNATKRIFSTPLSGNVNNSDEGEEF